MSDGQAARGHGLSALLAAWLRPRANRCPTLGETASLASACEQRSGIVGDCQCIADLPVGVRRLARDVHHS